MKYWFYLKYLLCHKWYVFLACRRLGIMRRGLTHDWSKWLPSEWFPYSEHFYGRFRRERRDSTGYYKPADTGDPAFDFAWLLHQKRNRHHWQWWVLPLDGGGIRVLPMDDISRREMLADWIGAGRAQGRPDTKHWYEVNGNKLQLHPETRAWIERELGL